MNCFFVFGLGTFGGQLTKTLLAQGATVRGFDKSMSKISQLQLECECFSSRCQFSQLDFRMFDSVEEQIKHDLLIYEPYFFINCFGEVHDSAKLWHVEPTQFKELLDNNLVSLFNLFHVVGSYLSTRRGGIVVSFTSKMGRHPASNLGHYVSTLFGEEGLSKSFAADLADFNSRCYLLDTGRVEGDLLYRAGLSSGGPYLPLDEWGRLAAATIQALPDLPEETNGKDIDLQSATVKKGERQILSGRLLATL
ncbi:hypothetical protein GEMRC1_009421 [Eukaryota sp. GEM-RC1]